VGSFVVGIVLDIYKNKKERERERWIVEFVGDIFVIKKAESIVDGGWVHLWWGSCVTYIYMRERKRESSESWSSWVTYM